MLLFSTILDISGSMTKDDFIKLVIEWNRKSPYPENVIPGIGWNGERSVRYGNDSLWLGIEEYRSRNIIAVRFEKRDERGAVWDTDYVMNFSLRKMAVRLERSYTEDAPGSDQRFATPHFISMLIDRGYLEKDCDLPVQREPRRIDEGGLGTAADVINGKARYRLPVVFVSSTVFDEDPVDADFLASRLKGVAHVLVQQSSGTNAALREATGGKAEENGAIGIYYPDGRGHQRFAGRSVQGRDQALSDRAARAVIQYASARMTDALFTWQGVSNAILRDRLGSSIKARLDAEQAKKSAEDEYAKLAGSLSEEERKIREQALADAKAESDEILESVDEELKRLEKQVAELTHTNEALAAENQGLKAKLDSRGQEPVLMAGDEKEFYPGEIKDLLLAVLSDALDGIGQKTRRHDVVEDIIRNNDYLKLSKQKADRIRPVLRNYDGMSAKTMQELKRLGFVITGDGKHYKVTYHGDGRYQLAFSKTPSDSRTGKNCAQELIKLVF